MWLQCVHSELYIHKKPKQNPVIFCQSAVNPTINSFVVAQAWAQLCRACSVHAGPAEKFMLYRAETHFGIIGFKEKKFWIHTLNVCIRYLSQSQTRCKLTHTHARSHTPLLLTCAVRPPVPGLGPEPPPAVWATLRRPRTRKLRIPPRYRTPQTPCPVAGPQLSQSKCQVALSSMRARAYVRACVRTRIVLTEHVLLDKKQRRSLKRGLRWHDWSGGGVGAEQRAWERVRLSAHTHRHTHHLL